jgi:hypothetical protein
MSYRWVAIYNGLYSHSFLDSPAEFKKVVEACLRLAKNSEVMKNISHKPSSLSPLLD